MQVFLTGATGVVGSRALPLLIAQGHEVTAIGRSLEKCRALEQQGARAVQLSLFDSGSLARAMAKHDAAINLATAIPRSAVRMMLPWAWRENDRIRTIGSAAMVTAALDAGVSRLVQESFAPMYADGGESWLDESSLVAPARYNRSTLDAESSAARFTIAGGTGVVLRFAAFYGPDRLFREMLDMIRRGLSPLPGDPKSYFTSVAQEDAAAAVVAALRVPAGVYNVAEDDPMRRGDWVSSLARAAGLKPPRFLPRAVTRMGGGAMQLLSRSLRISNRRFRDASEWAPRYARAEQAWPDILAALEQS